MKPLFSKDNLMILESLSFTKTLYAFDFDGTLSRIAKTPAEATIGLSTNELLKKLASLVPVAVVSGRSLADLKNHLVFNPKYLIGNHGLEGLGLPANALVKASEICFRWKNSLIQKEFEHGVDIEDKTYSLAIHYRRSRRKRRAKADIAAAIETLNPRPRVIAGKSVVNLLPVGAPHKGAAVLELGRQIGVKHIFYIGDDYTDEDVFSLPEERIMTVRVGKKYSSYAQYYIENQSKINQLLRVLIQHYIFRDIHQNELLARHL